MLTPTRRCDWKTIEHQGVKTTFSHFIAIADFSFLFLWKITIKTSNHAHICVQQVKTYKIQDFVLNFMSEEFSTVFSTAIFTKRG